MARSETGRVPDRWLALLGLAALALLLPVDDRLFQWVLDHRTPLAQDLLDPFYYLGTALAPVAVAGLVLAWGWLTARPDRMRLATLILLSAVFTGLCVVLLKPLVGRTEVRFHGLPKPGDSWLLQRWGRFPSGHASVAFAISGVLARRVRWLAPIVLAAAALAACSRVVDGAHMPADVLAGALLGLAVSGLVVRRWALQPARRTVAPADPGPSASGS